MTVITVEDKTSKLPLARRLGVNKDEVVKMLLKGEIRGQLPTTEVVGLSRR